MEDIKAIHLSEFNVNHSSGYAGQCDALIDTENPDGHSELTIVDFKTYGKDTDKPEKYLQDHLLQIGAYNEGLYEKQELEQKRIDMYNKEERITASLGNSYGVDRLWCVI